MPFLLCAYGQQILFQHGNALALKAEAGVRQFIDLLDQIASVPSGDLGATARAAIDALRRGVITYSAVTD